MRYRDDTNPKKRGGCLRKLCGCALGLVFLLAAAGLLLWYALGRWTPAGPVWDRAPADSVWAMEVHDARQVLAAVLRHPVLRERLAGMARGDGDAVPGDMRALARGLLRYERWLSPFHHYLFPNALVVGSTAGGPDSLFCLFQPTRLMGWLLPSPEQGIVRITAQWLDPLPPVFVAVRDGWAVAAVRRENVAAILDSWERPSAPFGPASGVSGPSVFVGLRSPKGEEAARDGTGLPPATPGSFMLGDPFAVAGGEPVPTPRPVIRCLLQPEKGEWVIRGEVLADDAALGEELPLRLLRAGLGIDGAMGNPRSPEVVVTAVLNDELRRHGLAYLDSLSSSWASNPDPRAALGWKWFRHAWLDTVGNGVVLSMDTAPRYGRATDRAPRYGRAMDTAPRYGTATDAEAGSGMDGGVPPMPQFALGWTLRDGLVPRLTGETFTESLTAWLEALQSREGPPLLRALGNAIEYRVEDLGLEGVVVLPHVPASGARPAWKQTVETALPMGWLASHPAGIQEAIRRGTPAFRALRPAEGMDGKAAVEWYIDRELSAQFDDWLRDRLQAIPQRSKRIGEKKARAETVLDAVATFCEFFPRGRILATGNASRRQVLFSGRLPDTEERR